jgi:hypothetical protein
MTTTVPGLILSTGSALVLSIAVFACDGGGSTDGGPGDGDASVADADAGSQDGDAGADLERDPGFRVVGCSPENGSVEVPATSDLWVEFSEPVERVRLHLTPEPPGGIPQPVSNGDRTVFTYENPQLDVQTQYRLMVLSGVSQAGRQLADVFESVFTTGASLADTRISGKLLYLYDPPTYFPTDFASGSVKAMGVADSGAAHGYYGLAAAAPSGDWSMDHVMPGEYFLVAELFRDGNYFVGYSGNEDLVPFQADDTVTLSAGQQLVDQDLGMFIDGFSITTIEPAADAFLVPTSTSLKVTFSARVNTIGARIFLEPEPMSSGSLVNADEDFALQQEITLAADTSYGLFVQNIDGRDGGVLLGPKFIRFGTGASLPTGSVSGSVNLGADPAQEHLYGPVFVALARSRPGTPHRVGELRVAAFGVLPDGPGSFSLAQVPAGTYTLFAWVELYEHDAKYALAYLDTNGDSQYSDEDLFALAEGEVKEGQVLTLSPWTADGSISGTITLDATLAGLVDTTEGIAVLALPDPLAEGLPAVDGTVVDNPDGTYTITGLYPDLYYISGLKGHATGIAVGTYENFYNKMPVTVGAGDIITGIDFVMYNFNP